MLPGLSVRACLGTYPACGTAGHKVHARLISLNTAGLLSRTAVPVNVAADMHEHVYFPESAPHSVLPGFESLNLGCV